ncbi:MAG: hypothetical protein ACTHM6_07260 [Tepidisphaeraceae bacterium]
MTSLLLSGFSPAAPASFTPMPDHRLADIKPLEVRIRKMHLVRPDLLHYPIQYDVYC